MPRFIVNGIALNIPGRHLTPPLREALETGRYEQSEAAALERHLRDGDRFLDLGAGAGYLVALAALRLGVEAVAGVEGDPEMAEVARRTVNRATGADATVEAGAVVPSGFSGSEVDFIRRGGFWASSLPVADEAGQARLTVAALPLEELLARHRPSVLCVDIEGGEAELFDYPLPTHVRLVILELHPKRYGASGVRRIFDGLSASGMAYCPAGSRGATVVFERVGPE